MFREGPEGFQGELNAGKYSTITVASPATTTRDLSDLVSKGALTKDYEEYRVPVLKEKYGGHASRGNGTRSESSPAGTLASAASMKSRIR
jgi:hypothetical protein